LVLGKYLEDKYHRLFWTS